MSLPPRAPFRILLVKTSSLGDVIHNLPLVSDLARELQGVEIDWLVEESFAAIPALHPAVRRVIPVALRRWRQQLTEAATWRQLAAFRRNLRETRYDCVLDSQGLLKSALLTRYFAATSADGYRCGYAAEAAREPLAARCYDQTFVIPKNLHAVERNRWLAAAVFDYPPPSLATLDYGLAPAAVASNSVVLLTATSRDDKLWAEDHWIALGQFLAGLGLNCLLPGGSPRERERAARLAAAIPNAQALPPLDLPQLAQTLGQAQLAVGVDTGLTHLAAAVRTPTLALYCASEPGLTGVLGSAFHRNLGERGAPPTVAEVSAACTEALAAPR